MTNTTAMINRIFRGVLSMITTFVLMAAPIAAIVYSSDATVKQAEYRSAPVKYTVSWQTQVAKDEQGWAIERGSVSEQIIAMAKITDD